MSILSQRVSFEIEVLIGIDNCENTLKYVLENKKLFSKCRVFYFEQNVGTYNIKNNLIKKTNSNYLLFFDSDDLMGETMLSDFFKEIRTVDIVRFKFQNFQINNGKKVFDEIETAWGVFGAKKSVFNRLIGFQPWHCNADVEFVNRAEFRKLKIQTLYPINFLRREHEQNLTKRQDTGMQSEIRKTYEQEIDRRRKEKDWQNPQIETYSYYQVNEIYST